MLHSVGDRRRKACSVELDCFAVFPSQHVYHFSPTSCSAKPLVTGFASSPASAVRILRYVRHRKAEVVYFQDSLHSLCQSLGVADNHGFTSPQRELPVFALITQRQGDTPDGVRDVIFAVCHSQGREVIHKLTRFQVAREAVRVKSFPECSTICVNLTPRRGARMALHNSCLGKFRSSASPMSLCTHTIS